MKSHQRTEVRSTRSKLVTYVPGFFNPLKNSPTSDGQTTLRFNVDTNQRTTARRVAVYNSSFGTAQPQGDELPLERVQPGQDGSSNSLM
jgi:hypothetical protein